MTPQARILSVIEILESFLDTKQPADGILNNYLKTRRYIGSKDRRFINDFFWKIIRNLAKICFASDLNPEKTFKSDARLIVITALKALENYSIEDITAVFSGLKYAPEALKNEELQFLEKPLNFDNFPENIALEMPLWLYEKLQKVFGSSYYDEMKALLDEANPVLRINTIKTSVDDYIAQLDKAEISYQKSQNAPLGIILDKRINTGEIPGFNDGLAEFQDEASQLIALLCQPQKQAKVLDFCAGAGGKSLALAAIMKNDGEIEATDISRSKLNNIYLRQKRAGAKIINPISFEKYEDLPDWFKNYFDVVLVDSPCSGTGTFRRTPDAKWRIEEKRIETLNNLQMEILEEVLPMLKTGGRLVYATCSMLADENENIINEFLRRHKNLKLVNANQILYQATQNNLFNKENYFLNMTPFKNKTDGFFGAVMEKL
ncbi:MAG: RsmB/NOP family class I SAM-dependent RNA methyltransferase [Alphaproteobacteria bacterium]